MTTKLDSKTPTPLFARIEAAPERLIDAAREVFLERGFPKTTISAIAKAARMSKATVYGHFLSKEELFIGVALCLMRDAHSEFLPILDGGSTAVRPDDAAAALVQLIPAIVESCPLFFELWAMLTRDPALKELCLSAFRDFYLTFADGLAAIIERAAPGKYQPGEARAHALALSAAIDGLSYQWLFMDDRVLLTRTADAVRETWVRG
ncbi:MAG: TetR/AcrR family transcriptional regulator, partial [Planctomycetota bacterium]